MPVTPARFPSAELARRSQEHLQRTVKYGGRSRLPSPGETQAFLVWQGWVREVGHYGTPWWGQGVGASGHW